MERRMTVKTPNFMANSLYELIPADGSRRAKDKKASEKKITDKRYCGQYGRIVTYFL
jgi:hypothetical protein